MRSILLLILFLTIQVDVEAQKRSFITNFDEYTLVQKNKMEMSDSVIAHIRTWEIPDSTIHVEELFMVSGNDTLDYLQYYWETLFYGFEISDRNMDGYGDVAAILNSYRTESYAYHIYNPSTRGLIDSVYKFTSAEWNKRDREKKIIVSGGYMGCVGGCWYYEYFKWNGLIPELIKTDYQNQNSIDGIIQRRRITKKLIDGELVVTLDTLLGLQETISIDNYVFEF